MPRAGAIAEAEPCQRRGAVGRRVGRRQRRGVVEVGGSPSTVSTLGPIAPAEQPQLGITSIRGDGGVHQLQAAGGITVALVSHRAADHVLRAVRHAAAKCVNQEIVGAIRVLPHRVEDVAQVPLRRRQVGLDLQRLFERLDRLGKLAALLLNDTFVVE